MVVARPEARTHAWKTKASASAGNNPQIVQVLEQLEREHAGDDMAKAQWDLAPDQEFIREASAG